MVFNCINMHHVQKSLADISSDFCIVLVNNTWLKLFTKERKRINSVNNTGQQEEDDLDHVLDTRRIDR